MNKTRVINFVGASGSGKDTIVRELARKGLVNDISSYTTRAERYSGEYGHNFIVDYAESEEYFYIENYIVNGELKEVYEIVPKCNIIAYFNSYESGNHYFATDNQVKRNVTNAYRVDPNGAKQVHEYYRQHNFDNASRRTVRSNIELDQVEVMTIFIMTDESVRYERLKNRYYEANNITESDIIYNTKLQYEAFLYADERIRQDREIFKNIKCDYVISNNDNLEDTVEIIENIIKE